MLARMPCRRTSSSPSSVRVYPTTVRDDHERVGAATLQGRRGEPHVLVQRARHDSQPAASPSTTAEKLRITPALPATATSFKVDVSGLSDGTTYTLTAAADSIKDACGTALAASHDVELVQCAGDTTAPKLLSDAQTLSCNTAAHTYTMKFDEGVALAANAITIDGRSDDHIDHAGAPGGLRHVHDRARQPHGDACPLHRGGGRRGRVRQRARRPGR